MKTLFTTEIIERLKNSDSSKVQIDGNLVKQLNNIW
jgi:hypothetical protein